MVDILVDTRSEQKRDTRELETSTSHIGEIVEVPVYVPCNATCHTFIIAVGEEGSTLGELDHPFSVAIHENTHQIFVANENNHRVEIFSETGEFINQLGV